MDFRIHHKGTASHQNGSYDDNGPEQPHFFEFHRLKYSLALGNDRQKK